MRRDQKQLNSIRTILTQIAAELDMRFSVKLWDGSLIPLGHNVDPSYYISIDNPGVIGSLNRNPNAENLLRQYATGQIEFHGGDLINFGTSRKLTPGRNYVI